MTKEKKKNVEEAVTKAISDLNTVNGYKNSGVVPYAVLILALLENIVERRLGVEHLDAFLNIDRGLPLKGQPINLNRADMMLLLDDVLSELDGRRQNYLLNSIENIQTLITCTGLDEFINHRFAVNRIYKVIGGTVTVEN